MSGLETYKHIKLIGQNNYVTKYLKDIDMLELEGNIDLVKNMADSYADEFEGLFLLRNKTRLPDFPQELSLEFCRDVNYGRFTWLATIGKQEDNAYWKNMTRIVNNLDVDLKVLSPVRHRIKFRNIFGFKKRDEQGIVEGPILEVHSAYNVMKDNPPYVIFHNLEYFLRPQEKDDFSSIDFEDELDIDEILKESKSFNK